MTHSYLMYLLLQLCLDSLQFMVHGAGPTWHYLNLQEKF